MLADWMNPIFTEQIWEAVKDYGEQTQVGLDPGWAYYPQLGTQQ